MNVFILLLLPLIMVFVIFSIFIGFAKAVDHGQALTGRMYDPKLPTTILNESFEVDAAKVQMAYRPRRPAGRSSVPPDITFECPGSFGSSLFLSPELKGDRFLESIGLSQESKTNDPELDPLFHIIAENAENSTSLLTDSAVREILIELGKTPGFEYLEIQPEFVKVFLLNFKTPDGLSFENYKLQLAQNLGAIAAKATNHLGAAAPGAPSRFSQRFSLYESKWVSVLLTISALFSVVFFVWVFIASEHYIHPFEAVFALGAGSALGLLVLIGLLRPWIRSFSLPSKTFFSLFTFAVILVEILGILAGISLNTSLDNTKPKVITAQITDKWIEHNKNSRSYYVGIQDPELRGLMTQNTTSRLRINSRVYNDVAPGHTVALIELFPGRFSFPWYRRFGLKNPGQNGN